MGPENLKQFTLHMCPSAKGDENRDARPAATNVKLEEIQNGDPRAFEQIYRQWSDAVYRYLVHIMGPSSLVEDLFQDTWIKALEKRRQLKRIEAFGPWLFRIARNLAFNEMRKSRRKGQVWILSNLVSSEQTDSDQFLAGKADAEPGPHEASVTTERREVVQEAMAELDAMSQEIIQLRYFEHFTLGEIAEMLDMPVGTVCTKIHRGLKAVRGRLQQKGIRAIEEI
jgi:RNA polymerase sigma-70 factor (ECF subfamily)